MSGNNNIKQTVIVFGATGPVGTALVDILCEKQPQWQIFVVTRSRKSAPVFPSQVTLVEGDVEDHSRVLELTANVDIIYCCVGFPRYERKYWSKHWPPVIDNLLQAVITPTTGKDPATTKKKLIFCDSLYSYGFNHDTPKLLTSSTPTLEPSLKSKPAIRALLRQKMSKHMQDYPQTLVVVGGSDFYGKGVNKSFLGDTFTRKMLQGQTPLCLGSANVVHDFCYVPDFANALYVTSIDSRALDHFWIAPNAIHDKTVQDLAHDIKSIIETGSIADAKQTVVKIQVLSKGMVRFLGWFISFMAEMKEMMDCWTKPYRIDDSEFCNTFHVEATPYEESLVDYVEYCKTLLAQEKNGK